MSYVGNDWQAEAANDVKALAASKAYRDKVDLRVQVAGPNAQRQVQQINAMVQAGAKAIVVYPISPTALNDAVKAACAKGVVIVAYDLIISEPCAYNTHIDQSAWGRITAEWLVKAINGKGNIVMITGVAGTTVDTLPHRGCEGSVRQVSRHPCRRRRQRYVEPSGRAHRAVENNRNASLEHDQRAVDAGRLLYSFFHDERGRNCG